MSDFLNATASKACETWFGGHLGCGQLPWSSLSPCVRSRMLFFCFSRTGLPHPAAPATTALIKPGCIASCCCCMFKSSCCCCCWWCFCAMAWPPGVEGSRAGKVLCLGDICRLWLVRSAAVGCGSSAALLLSTAAVARTCSTSQQAKAGSQQLMQAEVDATGTGSWDSFQCRTGLGGNPLLGAGNSPLRIPPITACLHCLMP